MSINQGIELQPMGNTPQLEQTSNEPWDKAESELTQSDLKIKRVVIAIVAILAVVALIATTHGVGALLLAHHAPHLMNLHVHSIGIQILSVFQKVYIAAALVILGKDLAVELLHRKDLKDSYPDVDSKNCQVTWSQAVDSYMEPIRRILLNQKDADEGVELNDKEHESVEMKERD